MSVPLHTSSDIVPGMVTVGVRPRLPIKGISLILGNDLAGGKVMPDLQLVEDPEPNQDEKTHETSIFQLVLSPVRQLRKHVKITSSTK